MNDVMFSSEKMNWETPVGLFSKLDNVFHFTLDVSASETNTKCSKFYSIKEDGLNQSWEQSDGGVWCNPPYGREISKWVEKAYKESIKHGTTIVLLIPARTDTKYFHDFIYGKSDIFFIKGRLKFLDENKKEQNSAPFPSMLVVYNYSGAGLEKVYSKWVLKI